MERARQPDILGKLEKQDKLDKQDKQDKLDKLEKSEHAQMVSKIRAGVDFMVLDGKEYEYYMEDEGMVCRDLLREITDVCALYT